MIRRLFIFLAMSLLCAAPLLAAPEEASLTDRIDLALQAGVKFLISRQSPDGAWRSQAYGMMKDGPSLSPSVLACLYDLPHSDYATSEACRKGSAYLSTLAPDDPVPHFSIYTAAIASRLAARHKEDWADEQSRWLHYLRERQLSATCGWESTSLQYGGWGYSLAIPTKMKPGDKPNPLAFSNISATVFALDALRFAKGKSDDPSIAAALVFVQRCQNFSDDAGKSDPAYDDGGFYFTPGDPAWNKAGIAGTDRSGCVRFHSYGAATADGLGALVDVGLPPDHPRVIAARRWLEEHFDAKSNPGVFEPDRKVLQNATFFYYVSSASRALAPHGKEFAVNGQNVPWTAELVGELLARQQPDGSWTNSFTDAKEDDPLVATPAAITALATCRHVIAR